MGSEPSRLRAAEAPGSIPPVGLVPLARLIACLASVLLALPASAQDDPMARLRGGGHPRPAEETPPPAPAPPAWQAPYDAGLRAFEAERYEEALTEFTRAYELGGPAVLAYNMAVASDRLDRHDDALQSYRRYLDLVPDAANRAEVEARIEELATPRSRIASRLGSERPILSPIAAPAETTEPAPAGPRSAYTLEEGPPTERPGPEWVVSWVFLGATALAAGGAGIASAVGAGQFDSLRAFCEMQLGCYEDEIASDPSHTSELAANALWVTTGILGAVTIASFVIEGVVSASPRRRRTIERAERGLEVSLEVGPGTLTVRGAF